MDWELHEALKGGVYKRKGIVVLLLENREDSIYNLNCTTFPNRLKDNMNYIILEQFASIHSRIDAVLDEAISRSKNSKCVIKNNRQPMKLRHKNYYDNYMVNYEEN